MDQSIWLIILTLSQAVLIALRIIEKKKNGGNKVVHEVKNNPASYQDFRIQTESKLARICAEIQALDRRLTRLEECFDKLIRGDRK